MNGCEADTHSADPAANGGSAAAVRLLPEGLEYLIEERPTLWLESESEYDALREAIFAELMPDGVIECILVKNLVDYAWEARRYRRLKTAAVHAEMPHVAARMLGDDSFFTRGSTRPPAGTVMRLARAATARKKGKDGASLSSLARKEHVTPEVLHYEAHKRGADMLHDISRECERMERRRDQLLKQIEDRRSALGAMARSLLKREATEASAVIVDAYPMPASKRRRPPAWSHGLTSRLARVEVSEEVNRLAEALLGGAPAEHRLLEAAREAAEALIHLHRVQTLRRLAEDASALLHLGPLSHAATRRLTLFALQKQGGHATCRDLVEELRLQAVEAGYTAGADITVAEGELSLLHSQSGQIEEVRRLREYERRALSRRRTALRRLDYERIEAERRMGVRR